MSEAHATPGDPTVDPPVRSGDAGPAAELPRKAADVVQLVVDVIHDKAVRPATLVTRAVVFGLVVASLAIVLAVVGSIAVLRLFDVYVFGHSVWLSYIVLGGALSLAGLATWSRRSARPSPARPH
ncbi:MAG: hypothetical protein ACRDXC_06890 [Acidimicrobiales bacterium]